MQPFPVHGNSSARPGRSQKEQYNITTSQNSHNITKLAAG
jgi:hypothetical protein